MKRITRVINYVIQHLVVRYVISGGLAGLTTIFVLYILNSIFGLHYLLSAVLGYLAGFVVSFILQKFWTFKSHEEKTDKQLVMYFASSTLGLALNTFLMYLFVEHIFVVLPVAMKFRVLLSQFVVGFLVACLTFFISRNIVFKYKRI